MMIVLSENAKNNYSIQINHFFRPLNLVTSLLFEEMIVLTLY